ncbi:unnamed protein product [Rhizoctonia solani]|uniref:Uncharacterized protein n=1 Tax=Rhizoctonia solani TaxID=456999 RepID=A0A8H3DHM4_9AGAM|nr:unnamed protein product [Rhizoctonia solani]
MPISNESSTSTGNIAPLRFSQVQLPPIRIENIYINIGDRLERPLASELAPWTRSEQFRHNATSIPIITALFNPFSAVNWLAFNSTNLELTGHAPFASISYNVSVTLVPGFVDRTEELTIPIRFNDTPMTFTTASFSVYVLGEQPANPETREWIPYLVMALIVVALISFFSALVTCCCWQDMCHRSPESSLLDAGREETVPPDGKENNSTLKESLIQAGDVEAACSVFAKNRQDFSQVTPYKILKPSSVSLRLANLHVVKQDRFIQGNPQTPAIYKNIQYANIPAGTSFAYKPKISRAASRFPGPLLNVRARAEPRSPEWLRFCPETMVVWGVVPEDVAQFMPDGLDILILSDSLGYALAKLRITIPTGTLSIDAGPSSSRFISLFKDGTRSEIVNGVDILYIPSDTKYRIAYRPLSPQALTRLDRYGFCSPCELPSWLTFNPHTLELSGNTEGHRSVDHYDLLMLDLYAQREVARLRVIVFVGTENGHLCVSRT